MYLNVEAINALSEEFEKDTKAIKEELYKICWYMRGSISLSESYSLTVEDREIIRALIEENLETTKKSGLPFF